LAAKTKILDWILKIYGTFKSHYWQLKRYEAVGFGAVILPLNPTIGS